MRARTPPQAVCARRGTPEAGNMRQPDIHRPYVARNGHSYMNVVYIALPHVDSVACRQNIGALTPKHDDGTLLLQARFNTSISKLNLERGFRGSHISQAGQHATIVPWKKQSTSPDEVCSVCV